ASPTAWKSGSGGVSSRTDLLDHQVYRRRRDPTGRAVVVSPSACPATSLHPSCRSTTAPHSRVPRPPTASHPGPGRSVSPGRPSLEPRSAGGADRRGADVGGSAVVTRGRVPIFRHPL